MSVLPLSNLPSSPSAADRKRATRWVWLAVVLWVAAFIATAGRPLSTRRERHTVLPDMTSAADRWTAGQPLYVRGGPNEFRYSPLVAAGFVPLAHLPPRIAEFTWRSLNFGTLIVGLHWAGRVGLAGRWTAGRAAAVFLLVLPVSLGSLNNAQSNPMVLGLMLIAAAAAAERRWNLSTLAIMGAVAFKLYPIALGLLLAAQFPRPLAWRLVVGLIVVAAAPFALQRAGYVAHEYARWGHYLLSEDRQRGARADWYRDLRAVWRSYVGRMSLAAYRWVQLSAGAAIAGLCLAGNRWRRWPATDGIAIATSLACCWMTALGPATESATYILIAPAIAWGLVRATGQVAAPARIGYAVGWGLLLVASLAVNVKGGQAFRQRLEPLPIAGLIVLVVAAAEAARRVAVGRPAAARNDSGPVR